jgi:hypothetical protein
MRRQKPQAHAGKKQKNLYLSDQARQLLAVFSLNMGISETAVVELLIREKAVRESVALPSVPSATEEDEDDGKAT